MNNSFSINMSWHQDHTCWVRRLHPIYMITFVRECRLRKLQLFNPSNFYTASLASLWKGRQWVLNRCECVNHTLFSTQNMSHQLNYLFMRFKDRDSPKRIKFRKWHCLWFKTTLWSKHNDRNLITMVSYWLIFCVIN